MRKIIQSEAWLRLVSAVVVGAGITAAGCGGDGGSTGSGGGGGGAATSGNKLTFDGKTIVLENSTASIGERQSLFISALAPGEGFPNVAVTIKFEASPATGTFNCTAREFNSTLCQSDDTCPSEFPDCFPSDGDYLCATDTTHLSYTENVESLLFADTCTIDLTDVGTGSGRVKGSVSALMLVSAASQKDPKLVFDFDALLEK